MRTGNKSDSAIEANQILVGVLSAAAAIASLIAIVLVVMLKLHRQLTYRLSLYQVLSSQTLLFAVTCTFQVPFMGYNNRMDTRVDRLLCTLVAFANMYTSLVKLCLTACVTCHLFYFAVLYKNHKKLEKWYLAVSLFLPLVPSVIPFGTSTYGKDHSGCWMLANTSTLSQTAGIAQMLLLWYVPVLLLVMFQIVMHGDRRFSDARLQSIAAS